MGDGLWVKRGVGRFFGEWDLGCKGWGRRGGEYTRSEKKEKKKEA